MKHAANWIRMHVNACTRSLAISPNQTDRKTNMKVRARGSRCITTCILFTAWCILFWKLVPFFPIGRPQQTNQLNNNKQHTKLNGEDRRALSKWTNQLPPPLLPSLLLYLPYSNIYFRLEFFVLERSILSTFSSLRCVRRTEWIGWWCADANTCSTRPTNLWRVTEI